MLDQREPGPITDVFHLPKAVELQAKALSELEDAELVTLQLECIQWQISINTSRDYMQTPGATVV